MLIKRAMVKHAQPAAHKDTKAGGLYVAAS